MTPEQVESLLKGHRFRFSLGTSDGPQVKDYLIEARKISEKILRRSVVNLEKGFATIQEHLVLVNEPQYHSVFLMRLFQVSLEQGKPREAADLTKALASA